MAPGELGRFFIRLFPVPLSCFSISTYLICFLLDRPRIQRYGQRGSPDRGQRTPPKLVQTTERILSLLKRNPFESSHAFSEKVSQGDFHHEKFTAAFRFPGAPQENRPRARLFAEAGGCLASLPGWGRYGNSALFSGSLIKRGQKGIYM